MPLSISRIGRDRPADKHPNQVATGPGASMSHRSGGSNQRSGVGEAQGSGTGSALAQAAGYACRVPAERPQGPKLRAARGLSIPTQTTQPWARAVAERRPQPALL